MLSIIIVNYKNPPLLKLCLKTLHQTISSEFNHEIIVVDSASTYATEMLVREDFPKVKLLSFKENIGYTKGVNIGIQNAQGDAVLVINPDIVPLKGSIKAMYAYIQKNPQVGMLGPQLLNFDGSPQQSCFRFYTPWTIICRRTFLGNLPIGRKTLNYFMLRDKDLSQTTPVDWLMGSAMMISRSAINKVGLMDEQLFLYMSDVDWPQRFWDNRLQVVYYPLAQMYHYHQRESKGRFFLFDIIFNKQTRWHIQDAIRYFRKYGLATVSNI